MYIVVDSLTGLTKSFAMKIGYPVLDINDLGDNTVDFKFFLITRCEGFGEIPKKTLELLKRSASNCIGVAVSGNRNWGKNYGISGDKIHSIFKIPLICKFEGSGFSNDVNIVLKYLKEYTCERN